MSAKVPDSTIILAAGKGSRMGSNAIPKVCFLVNGVPAINRSLGIYNQLGISKNLVVVGSLAGQVLETVGQEFDNVSYAYQKEQNGTANAIRAALTATCDMSDDAELLVVAGDRIIQAPVLERLFDVHYSNGAALTMLCVPTVAGSSQGRLVLDPDGQPLALVEMADVRQRRTAALLKKQINDGIIKSNPEAVALLEKGFFGSRSPIKSKLLKAFGEKLEVLFEADSWQPELWLEVLAPIPENFEFSLSSKRTLTLSPDEVENSKWCNTSVYLTKRKYLVQALKHLNTDNAQKEEYLSDIVKLIRQFGLHGEQVAFWGVNNADQVLGFNDPAELLKVEEILRGNSESSSELKLNPASFMSVETWCALYREKTELFAAFEQLYGVGVPALARQWEMVGELLEYVAGLLPADALIALVRSPGRVNIMGRHIDHQGGNCNLMTIGFETMMFVHPRDDDKVVLKHINEAEFAPCEFSIQELVGDLPWEDWLSVVNSDKLRQLISEYGVDWSSYVKASFLRLQKKFPGKPLVGTDLFVAGNIPMAAGLSSSSSLVVASAEAVVAANNLDTFPAQLVSLCGEGEWFVGTRGGSADHAAVKLGQRSKVVKVKFFEFGVEDEVPFPQDCALLVCDSGLKARKSSSAKDQFNHRVVCYRIGFALIKKYFPQYAPLLKHLRDVNVKNLHIPLSGIYRILLHLPEFATRSEIEKLLPEQLTELQLFWQNHAEPADKKYPIRSVVLYGLAECDRAARFTRLLRDNRIPEIGRLMNVSHDGDRVSKLNRSSNIMEEYLFKTDNSAILDLIDKLESGDFELVEQAQLYNLPGAYGCSLEDIDFMVDSALQVSGVYGAQLAGAGLGGCMMVLVKQEALDNLQQALAKAYYEPRNRPCRMLVCRPIAGAGVFALERG